MALLVRDVLFRVSELLGDVEPQFVTYSERELVHWLNDAQRVIGKFLPAAAVRVDAVKLVPGTRQSVKALPAARLIPGDGSAPADVAGIAFQEAIRNLGPDGRTPGRAIRLVPRRDLDALDPDWHQKTGAGPVEEVVFDPRTPVEFYVRPGVPADPATWIEVAYSANPAEIPNTGLPGAELYRMGGSSPTPLSLPDQYGDDVVAYVVARAALKDPDKAGLSATYAQTFLSSLNAQAKAMTGINPNLKALPLAPEPVAAAS